MTGAIARAILIVMLVATPSLLLPQTGGHANSIVMLFAMFAAGLVVVEYSSTYPSIIEFRYAPPINRLRYFTALALVVCLSAVLTPKSEMNTVAHILHAIGTLIGSFLDVPFSPIHLMTLTVPQDSDPALVHSIQTATGIALLISVTASASFYLIIRVLGWPTHNGAFNVWVNLPLFDPTSGGDVLPRLRRDGRLNIALGVLMPFLIPALIAGAARIMDPIELQNPHSLIWTVTTWAFMPTSLIMRGLAMGRVADLIGEKRRQVYAASASLQTA